MKTAFVVALCVLPLFAACTVGPNFEKPAPPKVSGYAPTPPVPTSSTSDVAGGQAQSFVVGGDIPGQWWALFRCKPLNMLIERALEANPNLKAAQAALTVAHEMVLAGYGAYQPSVSAGVAASRNMTSGQIAPVPNNNDYYFSLFTPQISVSYVPDVFGLNRRTVEALSAQASGARFALAATDITLSSNVAVGAIQEAALRAQIATAHKLVAINTSMLRILRKQFKKGYVGRLDVIAQATQLEQVRATLPPLQKQLVQQRDLLTALTGGFPDKELPEQFTLADLKLPQRLPLSLPSQLVEQRPDVLMAEANLHAASAEIGIAVAHRLPNVTLTADLGSMALAFSQIFAGGTNFWDLGVGLTQPVFEGGSLLHQERAARAAYVEADEQYSSTVLSAFQNVADTLHALQQDADALKAAGAAKDRAQLSLELTSKQWQSGYTGYLTVLSAEQAYQQAVLNLTQAQAERYFDTVALFQALGGGWSNRAELSKQ